MTVNVHRHGDQGVPKQRLDLLWVPTLIDEERCCGMPQCMYAKLCPTRRVHDAMPCKHRLEDAVVDVRVVLKVSNGIRENEVEIAFGARPCQSSRVMRTIGAMGMSRIPALLLGLPIFPFSSARCRSRQRHDRSRRSTCALRQQPLDAADGRGPCWQARVDQPGLERRGLIAA